MGLVCGVMEGILMKFGSRVIEMKGCEDLEV